MTSLVQSRVARVIQQDNMKSLYESLLGITNDDIDKTNLKLLWNQLQLDIKGTEKKPRINFLQIKNNNAGELSCYCSIPQGRLGRGPQIDDIPSLTKLFPAGIEAKRLQISKNCDHKLSELAALNIKVNEYKIDGYDTEESLAKLDIQVPSVYCDAAALITDNLLQRISKYTDKIRLDACMEFHGWRKMEDLKKLSNCPFDVMIINKGAYLFGLDQPRKNTVTIGDYLEGHLNINGTPREGQFVYRDSSQQQHYNGFKSKLADWIKRNPKTTLIMSWGGTMEKISLDSKGELTTTKITDREINKL